MMYPVNFLSDCNVLYIALFPCLYVFYVTRYVYRIVQEVADGWKKDAGFAPLEWLSMIVKDTNVSCYCKLNSSMIM